MVSLHKRTIRYNFRSVPFETMDFVVTLRGFGPSDSQHSLEVFSAIFIDGKNAAQSAIVANFLKEYKNRNSWITRKIRGIRYPRTFTYEQARTHIRDILRKARTIYVRGPENRQWLMNFLDGLLVPIIDLTELEYRSTVQLKGLFDCTSWEFRCIDKNIKSLKIRLMLANVT